MRHLPLASLALATLLLFGCDNATPPAAEPEASTTASTAATQANAPSNSPTCPAEDFASFLPTFMNDVAVQKAFTTDPLQSDSVDANAEPEPKTVSKTLAHGEITFPVMPDDKQQAKDGLKLTKNEVSATEVTVKLAKDDTDYQMSFYFRKDSCWHLYRMKDDSL